MQQTKNEDDCLYKYDTEKDVEIRSNTVLIALLSAHVINSVPHLARSSVLCNSEDNALDDSFVMLDQESDSSASKRSQAHSMKAYCAALRHRWTTPLTTNGASAL